GKALLETAQFNAHQARLYADAPDKTGPWLVTGAVLIAQQAAALALKAADDTIPAQSGATELLLRAANKDRLPAPYTLPFGMASRQSFDRLVDARNSFMHPRGVAWFVSSDTLARGLPVATGTVRHLMITQPVMRDLCTEPAALTEALADIDGLAEFLS
ncbi:MAG: hypothetical protein AAGH90_11660, partial [Pseudomonadota bacterium]